MFRFLRPRLNTGGGGVYGLAPLTDTWGAARLVFEKQFTYPLDSQTGPGIKNSYIYRIAQPAPVLAIQGALLSGIAGVNVGSFYSYPATLVNSPDVET